MSILILGIFEPENIMSLTNKSVWPLFPPGWNTLNLSLENLILFINATAKQSPNNKVILVLEVGTIPVGSASFTLGISILISLAFIKVLSGFEARPIILILNLFAYFKTLVSSVVFPE